MTSWTKAAKPTVSWRSALVPCRGRVLGLGVRDAVGEDGVVGAVLDLFHHHRLVDVDPAAVELDLPEEHRHVERRKRLPHLLPIERPGLFDGALQGKAG